MSQPSPPPTTPRRRRAAWLVVLLVLVAGGGALAVLAWQREDGARQAHRARRPRRHRAALARIDGWLQRLWSGSEERARKRRALQSLREQPLAPGLPTRGSTLAQPRRQRSVR